MDENKPENQTATNRPVSPLNGQPIPVGQPFVAGDLRAVEAQKKAVEARRKRRTLREELLALLADDIKDKKGRVVQAQTAMSSALLKEALSGNTKAFEIIRDTIGEKPMDTVQISVPDLDVMNEIATRMEADAE